MHFCPVLGIRRASAPSRHYFLEYPPASHFIRGVYRGLLIGGGGHLSGMFRNPLVSPDILGVSSGASLGAAFAILNGAANWLIQLSAFTGGVAAVAFSYLISRKSAHSQILSLVLTGSMVMALCNAGVTMIKYVSDPNDVLQQITFCSWGALPRRIWSPFVGAPSPWPWGLPSSCCCAGD